MGRGRRADVVWRMNLLLDTHIYLWMRTDSARLSPAQREAMTDPRNVIFLSAVSASEIAVKQSIGKLNSTAPLLDDIAVIGLRELPFTFAHARELEALPLLHRDPFDRMLIAQARAENMTLLTVDSQIARYDVPVIQ